MMFQNKPQDRTGQEFYKRENVLRSELTKLFTEKPKSSRVRATSAHPARKRAVQTTQYKQEMYSSQSP